MTSSSIDRLPRDVQAALAVDMTIDITTNGRLSGELRRIEIWFLNIDGLIYITGLLIAGACFIRQHLQARRRDREAFFRAFLNNHRVGQVIFIGLSADYYFQP